MSYAETINPNAPVSLIEKWDKTFAESLKVDHRKVTFQKPLRDNLSWRSLPAEGSR